MTSIVEQLAIWAKNNSQILRSRGVKVIDRFPQKGSSDSWKGSVSLAYNEILISYTVWERSGLQTELIIMNALTRKTIEMVDKNPEAPWIVHADLDRVVTKLLGNAYREMESNPKLIIT